MKNVQVITLFRDNITDFAKERNKLLLKAKKEWVLFLDSDEEISTRRFPLSNEFSGYMIRRDNYFLGTFVGSDWIVRLGKRGAGKWVRRVHELWKINGKVGCLPGDIFIRHNTAGNLHDYIAKINFYSTLHALANREEGKKSSLFKIVFYSRLKFFTELFKSKHIVFSIMQSLHSFLSWSKLYFLRS